MLAQIIENIEGRTPTRRQRLFRFAFMLLAVGMALFSIGHHFWPRESIPVSASSSVVSTPGRVEFTGTVTTSKISRNFPVGTIITHFDPRFQIAISVDESADSRYPKGATVQLAIHSPTMTFGTQEVVGHRFRFSMHDPARHTGRYLDLRAEPQ